MEDFTFDSPKTKQYDEMLRSLNIKDSKSLLLIPAIDKNVVLSARNIQDTKVMVASDINTYEILKAKNIVLSESSIELIQKTLDN